ncbi:hypothetical protein PISMIDRAFT_673685 [Pisolithus microcarpus 441]|uniref:Uncharacterized protein n=1 Tax=Pisolithus microcarpus 441 TaxID=765257 RepID=A0A0C9ZH96_9AGAM|nr:hypothetical protein PISMIDRAFT_673685 [Pisolithus microcarpus 441]
MAATVSGYSLVGCATPVHNRPIRSFKKPFRSICSQLVAPLVIFYHFLMDYRTI